MDILQFLTWIDRNLDLVNRVDRASLFPSFMTFVDELKRNQDLLDTLHTILQDEIEYYSQEESESEEQIIENLKRAAEQLNFSLIPSDNPTNQE